MQPPVQVPVLGKIRSLFEYIRNDQGRPVGGTHDRLCSQAVDALTQRPETLKITAKVDGSCCLVRNGQVYPRYDRNVHRQNKPLPAGWFPTTESADAGGHMIGFRDLVPKNDKWHVDAMVDPEHLRIIRWDGERFRYSTEHVSAHENKTLELVGPKLNNNKHGLELHAYAVHGDFVIEASITSHSSLREWLQTPVGSMFEGVVIHDMVENAHYKVHRGQIACADLPWRRWEFV